MANKKKMKQNNNWPLNNGLEKKTWAMPEITVIGTSDNLIQNPPSKPNQHPTEANPSSSGPS